MGERGIAPPATGKFLRVLHNPRAEVTCIAFSHGGAGATAWTGLSAVAPEPPGFDLIAAKPAGRESRFAAPPSTTATDRARDAIHGLADLGQLDPDRLIVAGICYGGVIAYEFARLLSEGNTRPAHLVLFDVAFGTPPNAACADLPHAAFDSYVRAHGLLPEWMDAAPSLRNMSLKYLAEDARAHAGFRWPTAPEPVTGSVIAVPGTTTDESAMRGWLTVGDHGRVELAGPPPAAWLEDGKETVYRVLAETAQSSRTRP